MGRLSCIAFWRPGSLRSCFIFLTRSLTCFPSERLVAASFPPLFYFPSVAALARWVEWWRKALRRAGDVTFSAGGTLKNTVEERVCDGKGRICESACLARAGGGGLGSRWCVRVPRVVSCFVAFRPCFAVRLACIAVCFVFPPVSALTMLLTTLSSRDPFPRSRSSTSDMPLASCLVCHCPPTVRFLSPLALVSRWSSTVTPFPHSLSDPSACCTNFRGRAGACVCVQGRPLNVFAIDSGYYARPAQRAAAFGYFPSC